MENKGETKILDPNNSEIKISNNRNENFYEFLSKIILKKFGYVELSSLGNTCEKSVKIANYLVRNNYAVIENMYSDEVEMEKSENKRKFPACKFYIKLSKTNQFDKLVEGKLK